MPKAKLSARQMVAFKIGARARKFAVEGCPMEGYEYLYGCLAEARSDDPELYGLLKIELEKLERRLPELVAEDA